MGLGKGSDVGLRARPDCRASGCTPACFLRRWRRPRERAHPAALAISSPGRLGSHRSSSVPCVGSLCPSSSTSFSPGQHLRASMGCPLAACCLSCPFPRAAMVPHHWEVASLAGCCASSFIGMLLGWVFGGCWWLRTARASSLPWGLLQSRPGGSRLPFHFPLGFG